VVRCRAAWTHRQGRHSATAAPCSHRARTTWRLPGPRA